MTLNQLETLNEDELAMIMYIVNILSPLDVPKIQLTPRHLTWFRPEALNQKVLDCFPRVNPEYHEIYKSLLEKMGLKIEIKKVEPQPPVSASAQPSGSV